MTNPRSALAAAIGALTRDEAPGFIQSELSTKSESSRQKRLKKRKPSGKDRTKIKAARKQRVRNRKK